MAVENKWAVDELETDYPQTNYKKEGQVMCSAISKVTIAAADSIGSVYGLVVLPANGCVKDIKLACEAIAGNTDYDIGLYRYDAERGIGAVIDKDMFLDGQSLASALVRGSEVSGMTAISIDESDQTVRELVEAFTSATDTDSFYALALTANVVGTADGLVVILTDFVPNS